MNRRHIFLALPLLALLLPTARTASAAPPDTRSAAPPAPAQAAAPRPSEIEPAAGAAAVVETQLVKPLAAKEARRNRFSRSYVPPLARRVRMHDGERSTDGRGAEFVAFAVDERSGLSLRRSSDDDRHWRKDAIVGCVYPARDEIFVKRGDKFFAAELLLGKKTDAADETVCRPAPARIDQGQPALANRQPEPQQVAGLKR
jgi:hypothetical protein